MNIWLKEIELDDGIKYYELLSELSRYEDVYAKPVPEDFSLEEYEYFKKTRVHMASGINLPNNVVQTDTYYVMSEYEPIGYATLKHKVDMDKPGGHFGCCLKKEYQNKGIGTIVSELLSKRAYFEIGLDKVIYTAKDENIQSKRSLEHIDAKYIKKQNGYHFYEVDLRLKFEKERNVKL